MTSVSVNVEDCVTWEILLAQKSLENTQAEKQALDQHWLRPPGLDLDLRDLNKWG